MHLPPAGIRVPLWGQMSSLKVMDSWFPNLGTRWTEKLHSFHVDNQRSAEHRTMGFRMETL